jgi:hypothetical protein
MLFLVHSLLSFNVIFQTDAPAQYGLNNVLFLLQSKKKGFKFPPDAPAFYRQLFLSKVLSGAFLCLKFALLYFGKKKKSAFKYW